MDGPHPGTGQGARLPCLVSLNFACLRLRLKLARHVQMSPEEQEMKGEWIDRILAEAKEQAGALNGRPARHAAAQRQADPVDRAFDAAVYEETVH